MRGRLAEDDDSYLNKLLRNGLKLASFKFNNKFTLKIAALIPEVIPEAISAAIGDLLRD